MDISATAAVLALVAAGMPEAQEVKAITNKKERVKRNHTKRQNPGKGRPAKGYDPVTKTWTHPAEKRDAK